MSKRIQLANQALRLLPSKTNPRVKRWQAPDGEGKASLKGKLLMGSNWLDPQVFEEMSGVLQKQHPHLEDHVKNIIEVFNFGPSVGFHSSDYKDMFPWDGGAARGMATLGNLEAPEVGRPTGTLTDAVDAIGIGGVDDYIVKSTGVALPLLKQLGLLERDRSKGYFYLQPTRAYVGMESGPIAEGLSFSRIYELADKRKKMAIHDGLGIGPDYSSAGLVVPLYAAQEALAKSTGHSGIKLKTWPYSIAPYVYAKLGFDFAAASSPLLDHFRQRSELALSRLEHGFGKFPKIGKRKFGEESDRIKDLFAPDKAMPRAWDIADATIDVGGSKPYPIGRDIMAMTTGYRVPMEKLFNDPESQARYDRTVQEKLHQVLKRPPPK